MRLDEAATIKVGRGARRFLCCFLVVALFAQAPALALTALPSSSAPGAAAAAHAPMGVRNAGLENAHRGISAFLVRFALLRCAGEAWTHALSRAYVYGGPPWFVVHRYYDPATGRYLTPDPLGDGLNPYGYAHGNPLALADPMGLCAAASTLGYYVAGAIAGAVGAAAAPWVAAAFVAAALVTATDALSTEAANWYLDTDISSEGSGALQEAFGCSKETADGYYDYIQSFFAGGGAGAAKGGGGGESAAGGGGGGSGGTGGPRRPHKSAGRARNDLGKARVGRVVQHYASEVEEINRKIPKSDIDVVLTNKRYVEVMGRKTRQEVASKIDAYRQYMSKNGGGTMLIYYCPEAADRDVVRYAIQQLGAANVLPIPGSTVKSYR